MVPKVGTGRGIKGLVDYVTHDKGHATTSERVAWTHTRNLATSDPRRAAAIMGATARAADQLKADAGVKATGRKLDKTVVHLSLSWPPDTNPDQATMIAAGREAMASLGVEDHQALMVAHTDEDHPHLHIVIGRTHPATGKAAPLSNDRLELSRWAERWERDHEGVRCAQRVENNARRAAGEFVRYEPPADQDLARAAVRHIGPDAFQAACRDIARPELWKATSREDADRRLAGLGLRIEDVKRGGQVVTDGTHRAKLSDVAAGMTKLEKAWRANAERSHPVHAADAGVGREESRRDRAPVGPGGEDRGVAAAPDAPGETSGAEQAGPDRPPAHRGERGPVGDTLDAGALDRALVGAGGQLGATADRLGQRPDQLGPDAPARTPESRPSLGEPGPGRDGDPRGERGRVPQAVGRAILDGGRDMGVRNAPNRPAVDAVVPQPTPVALRFTPEHAAALREYRADTVTDAIARAAEAGERAIADAERQQWAAIGGVIATAARGFAAGLHGQGFGYLGRHPGPLFGRPDRPAGGILGAAEERGRTADGSERRSVHDHIAVAGWALGRLVRGPADMAMTGYRLWREHEDGKLLARYEARPDGNDGRVGIWDRQANDGHGLFVDGQAPDRARWLLAERLATERTAQEARQEARRAAEREREAEQAREREAAQTRAREVQGARAREIAEARSLIASAIISAGSKPGKLRWDWREDDRLSDAECERRNGLIAKHWVAVKPDVVAAFRQQDPAGWNAWDRQQRQIQRGHDRDR